MCGMRLGGRRQCKPIDLEGVEMLTEALQETFHDSRRRKRCQPVVLVACRTVTRLLLIPLATDPLLFFLAVVLTVFEYRNPCMYHHRTPELGISLRPFIHLSLSCTCLDSRLLLYSFRLIILILFIRSVIVDLFNVPLLNTLHVPDGRSLSSKIT